MPKDKRAFIFCIVTSIVLWQFGTVIRSLCTKADIQISTLNNPVISFVYLKNTGGAFSILPHKTDLLIIFGILALLGLIFYTYTKLEFKDKAKVLVSTCLGAGILGNLIERIEQGYVIDFIQLNFINFAVFNFFDILISCSIILYVLIMLFDTIGKNKNAN